MSQVDETLKNAEKIFNIIAKDDERLIATIPELLNVIKELYAIRESRSKTREYIETWRRTKFKLTRRHTLSNGDVVDVDICAPDMTVHDMFTGWLFMYMDYLYKIKTGKTIGFAYALEILTQIYNSRRGNTYFFDLSNADMCDVFNSIEEESNNKEVDSNVITFNTKLTLTRLDELYNYLTNEKLINTTPEMWRYWFTKQSLQAGKKKTKIQWLGAGSVLSNVILLVCGNFTNHTETAMKAAFKLQSGTNYQQPTIIKKKKELRGNYPYKRIYEIIEHAENKLQS